MKKSLRSRSRQSQDRIILIKDTPKSLTSPKTSKTKTQTRNRYKVLPEPWEHHKKFRRRVKYVTWLCGDPSHKSPARMQHLFPSHLTLREDGNQDIRCDMTLHTLSIHSVLFPFSLPWKGKSLACNFLTSILVLYVDWHFDHRFSFDALGVSLHKKNLLD